MVVADDTASFASATGLVFDASSLLGGPRAKRAAIVIVSINSFPLPLPPLYFPLPASRFPLRTSRGDVLRWGYKGNREKKADRDILLLLFLLLFSPFANLSGSSLDPLSLTRKHSPRNRTRSTSHLFLAKRAPPPTPPPTPTPPPHREHTPLHVRCRCLLYRKTARSFTSPSRTSLLRLPSLRPIRS